MGCSLRAYARRHRAALQDGGIDLRAVARARTLAEYDTRVTCKVCILGFEQRVCGGFAVQRSIHGVASSRIVAGWECPTDLLHTQLITWSACTILT